MKGLSLLTIVLASFALVACQTDNGTILPGTAVQPVAPGPITFNPAVPTDIGRDPKPLSVLTIPKLAFLGGTKEEDELENVETIPLEK